MCRNSCLLDFTYFIIVRVNAGTVSRWSGTESGIESGSGSGHDRCGGLRLVVF